MEKIIVISHNAELSKKEFLEVMRTWNDMFVDFVQCGMEHKKIQNGLLRVAAAFYTINEIKGTPAEFRVKKVVKLAKTGDEKHLEDIYDLLREIEQIITE